MQLFDAFFFFILSNVCRDDALVLRAQTPELRPPDWLLPFARRQLRGSRAEDAGEAFQGDWGAAADGERLHQGFADVRGGDHRAAAEKTGARFITEKIQLLIAGWTDWALHNVSVSPAAEERRLWRSLWQHRRRHQLIAAASQDAARHRLHRWEATPPQPHSCPFFPIRCPLSGGWTFL